jgi:hypothetical protein
MMKTTTYFFVVEMGAHLKLGFSRRMSINQQVVRIGSYVPNFKIHYWCCDDPQFVKGYIKEEIKSHNIKKNSDLYWSKKYQFDATDVIVLDTIKTCLQSLGPAGMVRYNTGVCLTNSIKSESLSQRFFRHRNRNDAPLA